MKHLILISLAFLFFTSCQQKQDAIVTVDSNPIFDKKTELESIMLVIDAETSCFFQRDYECWKQHWINENYAFQAWSNDDGTFDSSTGFDTISINVKKYIEKYPLKEGETASHPEVIKKNIVSKFYSHNLCYLIWDQYNYTESIKGFNQSKEVRLMEKQDDKWKIVSVCAFWDYKNTHNSKRGF